MGPLLENFVAVELMKQISWSDSRVSLYHYRTTAGKEVDFVLEDRGGGVVGIEVKLAASVQARDFWACGHCKRPRVLRLCGAWCYTWESRFCQPGNDFGLFR